MKRVARPGGGVVVLDRDKLPKNIGAVADLADNATFTFRTKAMQQLWDKMIAGQITDGIWETVPGNVGSLFWGWISTAVGSSTAIRGKAPNASKTNYRLRKDIIKYVGPQVLKIVQKTEPDATMDDVGAYLDEISAAMKKVQKVRIRAPGMDAPAGGGVAASDIDKMRHELEWKFGIDRPRVEWEALNEGSGSRSGKYHFFAVYYDPDTEEYVGGSAYGSFGSSPKSAEIARGPDEAKVSKKVRTKQRAKERKGYMPSSKRLAYQRHPSVDHVIATFLRQAVVDPQLEHPHPRRVVDAFIHLM